MKILNVLMVICLATPAFAGHEGPYPAAPDYLRLLLQKFEKTLNRGFPNSNGRGNPNAADACFTLNSANRELLGDYNPKSGEAGTKTPGTAFWEWFIQCITKSYLPMMEQTMNGFDPLNRGRVAVSPAMNVSYFIGPEAMASLPDRPFCKSRFIPHAEFCCPEFSKSLAKRKRPSHVHF
jgi:hypothetical protein